MVKIIADSTCDLSPELTERYGIGIIPLYVRLGEDEYSDGVNITPQELYRWSDEHNETPKTAAPSTEDALELFEKELKENDGLVVFTISSQMSSSYNNLSLAAEEIAGGDPDDTDGDGKADSAYRGRIEVIDSENLSTGIGLLVIEAAEMARQGKSQHEIAERIRSMRKYVRASFVVDTLVYLHRGGRCSGLAAMLGSALKLHPRIEVADGGMRPGKKYRGRSEKYVTDYVKDMESELKSAKKDRVFITHSGCDDGTVEQVKKYLEGLNVFDEILVTRAGSVVSSHCGPGTLGVLFIEGSFE